MEATVDASYISALQYLKEGVENGVIQHIVSSADL
jgi:hypothetical protein